MLSTLVSDAYSDVDAFSNSTPASIQGRCRRSLRSASRGLPLRPFASKHLIRSSPKPVVSSLSPSEPCSSRCCLFGDCGQLQTPNSRNFSYRTADFDPALPPPSRRLSPAPLTIVTTGQSLKRRINGINKLFCSGRSDAPPAWFRLGSAADKSKSTPLRPPYGGGCREMNRLTAQTKMGRQSYDCRPKGQTPHPPTLSILTAVVAGCSGAASWPVPSCWSQRRPESESASGLPFHGQSRCHGWRFPPRWCFPERCPRH